jgi:iron only hydrogenase large subunit-like protein
MCATLQLVAAMRLLGFDYVFDTNYSADLTTMEEAHEFIRRVKAGGPFPMVCHCFLVSCACVSLALMCSACGPTSRLANWFKCYPQRQGYVISKMLP